MPWGGGTWRRRYSRTMGKEWMDRHSEAAFQGLGFLFFFFFFISYNLSNAHVYTQQHTQAHLCVKCTRTLSLGPTTSQTGFSCKSSN